jgi:F0F1-type ATP synthase membrane subunit c/vacuolar-type H+-ATPase subunit K
MSITNVNQINGFDAVQYNKLLEAAKSEYVSKAQVDQAILNAVNAGKSFSEALHTVNTALPTLPPPIGKGIMWDSGLAGLPSFGADYLALISDLSAEERRRSAEQRALQTEVIVDTINEQAAEMREKAVVQLCMGIATGLVSIAQGVGAGLMMSSGMKANAGLDPAAKQTADMALNTNVGAFNSGMGGVTGMLNSINQSVGGFYDADVKLMEADIERARAQADALRSLEDSLKEVIQKALAAMDSIQQSSNQTRTKILG